MLTLEQNTRWAELMSAAQQGDQRSYHKLLTEITPFIRHVLRKKISQHDWAEDITQDVLLGVHLARYTYDPARPFHAWLLAIARYKTMDALRKYYRKGDVEFADSDFLVTLADLTTNTQPDRHEDARELTKMLSILKSKQKRLLTLTKLQGRTIAEVAVSEGMSESAVKVSIHRAIKILKAKFGNSNET